MDEVQRIIELMKQHDLTAKKFTSEAGLSSSAITEWKKGKSKPSAKNLQKVADYFDVSIDYLLHGDNSDQTKKNLSSKTAEERENEELDRELEGVRFALSSKDPTSTGDLTLGEKRDVAKFIRFLRSQRMMPDNKDNDAKKEDGRVVDKP